MIPLKSARFTASVSIATVVLLACAQAHATNATGFYGPVQPIPMASPPPTVQVAPATRLTYVQDYSHLADLTAKDEAVRAQATTLARRQTASYVVGFGGHFLALALFVSGATFLAGESCSTNGYCLSEWNKPVMWSGVAILGSSFVTAMVLRPSRRDLLNLINEWNSRHADEPLTLSQEPVWWSRK